MDAGQRWTLCERRAGWLTNLQRGVPQIHSQCCLPPSAPAHQGNPVSQRLLRKKRDFFTGSSVNESLLWSSSRPFIGAVIFTACPTDFGLFHFHNVYYLQALLMDGLEETWFCRYLRALDY
ncbi:uncharacterized protein LOC143679809 [Tamandua tetradactyla]|uniref:uncharacterized protein LOC143679809 n=1 Tax=Tamandua tetradactyla TaxID=48850 RepID=UPI004054948B